MPRKRRPSSFAFRFARDLRKAEAVESGNPRRIARRAKDVYLGRALRRAGFWRSVGWPAMRLLLGVVLAVVALALPASAASAHPTITLGEAHAAVNRYGVERARHYDAERQPQTNELEWHIDVCSPHGPNSRRVEGIACTILTRTNYLDEGWTNYFTLWALDRREPGPSTLKHVATYGRVAIWVGPEREWEQ